MMIQLVTIALETTLPLCLRDSNGGSAQDLSRSDAAVDASAHRPWRIKMDSRLETRVALMMIPLETRILETSPRYPSLRLKWRLGSRLEWIRRGWG